MRLFAITLGALAAALFVPFFVAGCGWMYPAAVPIRTTAYPLTPGGPIAPTLLVLLPGRGDDAGAFAAHGFIDDVRATGAAVDVVAVNATFGYYAKETIVDRVWTDVIVPARQRGYRHIWLAGISMGGLGVVAIARQHEDALERLILVAPYLGPDSQLAKIRAAGGAARWTQDDPNDPYQRLWTFLARYGGAGPKPPDLTLAFGTNDRLVAGHRLLAPLLPPANVLEQAGGHDWTTWRILWRRFWSAGARAGL